LITGVACPPASTAATAAKLLKGAHPWCEAYVCWFVTAQCVVLCSRSRFAGHATNACRRSAGGLRHACDTTYELQDSWHLDAWVSTTGTGCFAPHQPLTHQSAAFVWALTQHMWCQAGNGVRSASCARPPTTACL
jgi:hypothetical protein